MTHQFTIVSSQADYARLQPRRQAEILRLTQIAIKRGLITWVHGGRRDAPEPSVQGWHFARNMGTGLTMFQVNIQLSRTGASACPENLWNLVTQDISREFFRLLRAHRYKETDWILRFSSSTTAFLTSSDFPAQED